MADHSSHSVCVVDNGLFVEFAVRLARDFGKVRYWSPNQSAFPTTNRELIGQVPGVERIHDYHEVIKETDLFVFPDVGYPELQEYLISVGKRVWGSRHGEELEQRRDFCKEVIKAADLPVGKYVLLQGVEPLKEYLQKHDKQYVKINRSRGDFETFRAENWDLIEPKIKEIEYKLGAKKDFTQFLVEEAIEPAVELGYDGYTVDGQFPSSCLFGIEIKGEGYLGHFRPYDEIPAPLREANDKLADVFAEYEYRNLYSSEVRITPAGVGYLTDPCCRAGSPPSEIMLEMYTNISDIAWFGAEGELIEPEPRAEWAAEIMLHSDWAENNWQPLDFPEEMRDHVKLYFPTYIDGRYYVVPVGHQIPAIGAVVGWGDTQEAAQADALDAAESVKGYFVDAKVKSMADAEEKKQELAEYGFEL